MRQKLENIWNGIKLTLKAVVGIAIMIASVFIVIGIFKFLDRTFNFAGNAIQNIKANYEREETVAQAERELKVTILNSVSVSNFDWHMMPTSDGDHVMKATFTVHNPFPFIVIKDFTIACTIFAKSGTQLQTISKKVYDIVEPNSKKIFRNIAVGSIHEQASKANCKIVDLQYESKILEHILKGSQNRK
jgi:hypothetical protein